MSKNAKGLDQLGESRESWCAVERKKEESWCRAQRKHFPDLHLTSSAMDMTVREPEAPRCQWKPDKPVLAERRHFAHRFDSVLNI